MFSCSLAPIFILLRVNDDPSLLSISFWPIPAYIFRKATEDVAMHCLSSDQIWQILSTCQRRIRSLVIGIAMTGSQLVEVSSRFRFSHFHPLL